MSGLVVRSKDSFSYILKDFNSINERIIPFFNKYLLAPTHPLIERSDSRGSQKGRVGTKLRAFEH